MMDETPGGTPERAVEQAADRLVRRVQQRGSSALVGNLQTTLRLTSLGGFDLPLSLNDGVQPTCYINCPSRAYLDYGREELDRMTRQPLLRGLGRAVLAGLGPLVKAAGLDRQVQLNNWLVATNILPPAPVEAWLQGFERLSLEQTGHVPVLRSVNSRCHGALLTAFEAAGLSLLPMRKVYLRDYAEETDWTSDERKDALLRDRDDLCRKPGSTFSAADFEQAARLYACLYLDKYTPLNPHYTAEFLQTAQAELGLGLEGLMTPAGEMVGVIGHFIQYGTLTGPIVGYDTSLPQKLGLYRRLRSINHGTARAGGLIYNMSAGAEAFKTSRGGRPALEYLVADLRRGPRAQRRAVRLLSGLLRRATAGRV